MSNTLNAVIRLVNTAPNQSVAEMFVLVAIQRLSTIVIQNNRPTDGGEGLVSQQAWWDAAAHSQEFLERTFGDLNGSDSKLGESS